MSLGDFFSFFLQRIEIFSFTAAVLWLGVGCRLGVCVISSFFLCLVLVQAVESHHPFSLIYCSKPAVLLHVLLLLLLWPTFV